MTHDPAVAVQDNEGDVQDNLWSPGSDSQRCWEVLIFPEAHGEKYRGGVYGCDRQFGEVARTPAVAVHSLFSGVVGTLP